jgi:hypothetical protein
MAFLSHKDRFLGEYPYCASGGLRCQEWRLHHEGHEGSGSANLFSTLYNAAMPDQQYSFQPIGESFGGESHIRAGIEGKSQHGHLRRFPRRALLRSLLGIGAISGLAGATAATDGLSELALANPNQPFTNAWRSRPVVPRRGMALGASFRPDVARALGLDPYDVLVRLLQEPVQLIRLGARWSDLQTPDGQFNPTSLDWQVATVARAGIPFILCVGAVKSFGYPEFFIPPTLIPQRLLNAERQEPRTGLASYLQNQPMLTAAAYPAILDGALRQIERLVAHYGNLTNLIAWQLENEAGDPVFFTPIKRLGNDFVERELAYLRALDAHRPILMTGTVATTFISWALVHWLTADQGTALAFAIPHADWIGANLFTRLAIAANVWDHEDLYLDGTRAFWSNWFLVRLASAVQAHGRKLLITEGQAEPWEINGAGPLPGHAAYSCPPEAIIDTYNRAAQLQPQYPIHAYLFWGWEHWLAYERAGMPQYLQAFHRIAAMA